MKKDREITRVIRLADEFRKLDPLLTLPTIYTFLIVAESPEGILMSEIDDRLGLQQSTTSRNVDLLCKEVKAGVPGMGLVEKVIDPFERRRRIVRLTPKGRIFANSLKQIMEAAK